MKEIIIALSKIQKELKAPKNQYNGFGKYNYRSCEDILEGIKPLLGDAILKISDEIVHMGDRFYVKATAIFCLSEEKILATGFARESDIKKGMDSAQITGSASSYARKYALNGLFCIDDTKDADTQKPETNQTKKQNQNQNQNQNNNQSRNQLSKRDQVLNTIRTKLGKLTDNYTDQDSMADICKDLMVPSFSSFAIMNDQQLNDVLSNINGLYK